MIPSLLSFLVSLGVGVLAYPAFIAGLRRYRSGQVIQAELPASHQAKAGTPTGGGILFVVFALIGGLLAIRGGHHGAAAPVAGLVAGGLLGFADDRRKLRVGSLGIPARLKFPLQVAFAIPVALLAHAQSGGAEFPFGDLGWLYWPLALIAIVGAANAINLTDGMDGLAGGLSVIAIGALVLLVPHALPGEKAVALVLCGGLCAFLVFNRHPARVFMGDTGSLALGYALAAMALEQGAMFLLLLLGLVFVLETLSVMIQVAYFKATGGRRVFKMTPIHYTFHLEGWSENRIALTFWAAGLLAALAAAGVSRV